MASGGFELSDQRDAYRDAVEEAIAAKETGRPVAAAEELAPSGKAVDLMAALQQSVEDARARRESGSPAAVHDLRPAKKTAKKTMKRTAGTAKKVAAKRKPPRSA